MCERGMEMVKDNGFKNATGECTFCGQQKILQLTEDEWLEAIAETNMKPQQIADEYASRHCNCKEGMDWRTEQLVMDKCQMDIEDMFSENHPEIASAFQEIKEPVYKGTIKRAVFKTPTGDVASMYKTGGNIELKFVKKMETKVTIVG